MKSSKLNRGTPSRAAFLTAVVAFLLCIALVMLCTYVACADSDHQRPHSFECFQGTHPSAPVQGYLCGDCAVHYCDEMK